MIDSNALAQLGGTLRGNQDFAERMGQGFGSGMGAGLRMLARENVDSKRRAVDEMAQHANAITLMNNYNALKEGGAGADLLNAKYEKEFDEGWNSGTIKPFSTEEFVARKPKNIKELRELNPNVKMSDDQAQYILNNWEKGQGRSFVWDAATGAVMPKDQIGGTIGVDFNEADLAEKLAQISEGRESLGEWATNEETMDAAKKRWLAAKYAGLDEDERKRLEDELFEADFKAKLLNMFGGDEKAMEAFKNRIDDPRFTKVDESTGQMRLKRPDELYFDVGNYAQFWAPEMANPYYQRAHDYLDLIKSQYGSLLSASKGMVDKYEQMSVHSQEQLTELQKQLADGLVSWNNIVNDPSIPDAQKSLAANQIASLYERIARLQENARVNQNKAQQALADWAKISKMKPEDFASSKYYGRGLMSELYPRSYLGYDPVQGIFAGFENPTLGRGSTSTEELLQSEQAGAAGKKALEFTGENAVDELKRSGLLNYLPVSTANRIIQTQTNYGGNLKLPQRKWSEGQEDIAPNQASARGVARNAWMANTYNRLESALNAHVKRLGIASQSDMDKFGLQGVTFTGSETRPFNFEGWIRQAPMADYVDYIMSNFWEKHNGKRKGESEEAYRRRKAEAEVAIEDNRKAIFENAGWPVPSSWGI